MLDESISKLCGSGKARLVADIRCDSTISHSDDHHTCAQGAAEFFARTGDSTAKGIGHLDCLVAQFPIFMLADREQYSL